MGTPSGGTWQWGWGGLATAWRVSVRRCWRALAAWARDRAIERVAARVLAGEEEEEEEEEEDA